MTAPAAGRQRRYALGARGIVRRSPPPSAPARRSPRRCRDRLLLARSRQGGAGGGDDVTLKLTGVAGRPAEAQAAIAKTVADAGAALDATDFSDVAPISASECSCDRCVPAIRATGTPICRCRSARSRWSKLARTATMPGRSAPARWSICDLGSASQNFALYGLEPNGDDLAARPRSQDLRHLPQDRASRSPISAATLPLLDRRQPYRLVGHPAAHRRPAASRTSCVTGSAGSRGADWPQRFATAAQKGNWRSEMVWFKMVDEVPN